MRAIVRQEFPSGGWIAAELSRAARAGEMVPGRTRTTITFSRRSVTALPGQARPGATLPREILAIMIHAEIGTPKKWEPELERPFKPIKVGPT